MYLRWISTPLLLTDNIDKGEVRTWGVRLVLQTRKLMRSFWSLWTSAQRKVWTNYYSGQRLTAITIHQYRNRAPGVRTKIEGLPRCKNLWSFSLFSWYYFPWLYWVDFSVASLYTLFYVAREFHRFLHRGWAKIEPLVLPIYLDF